MASFALLALNRHYTHNAPKRGTIWGTVFSWRSASHESTEHVDRFSIFKHGFDSRWRYHFSFHLLKPAFQELPCPVGNLPVFHNFEHGIAPTREVGNPT